MGAGRGDEGAGGEQQGGRDGSDTAAAALTGMVLTCHDRVVSFAMSTCAGRRGAGRGHGIGVPAYRGRLYAHKRRGARGESAIGTIIWDLVTPLGYGGRPAAASAPRSRRRR